MCRLHASMSLDARVTLQAIAIGQAALGAVMPNIDVVVPCYRYGHFLRECVTSVLIAGGVDSILIIDDASNNGSADVANELASENGRVEVIVHRANRGHIATYNEGIEWASAKYFLLLSADDLITPGCLRRAVSIMEQHPSISMTHGGEINRFPDQGAPVYRSRALMDNGSSGPASSLSMNSAIRR